MKKVIVLGLSLALSSCVISPAFAGFTGTKSFSSSRSSSSFSRPSRTVTPPKQVVNKTVINRTTVVQSAPARSSSGSGFLPSFLGGAAGGALGSWFMSPKHEEPSAPQEQPLQPVAPAYPQCDAKLYDCTPKATQ